ncbi:hypothetical protein JXJ21_26490 [candidate division KSB1 bacterium]|nr:hypothetical protein [candidate division KSB1 bacterium]
MELWEKVKKGLEGSAATISEKAAEWYKSGAQMVKEGADVVSEKASELSRLTRLKWDQHNLQNEIEQEFIELGGRIYDQWSEKSSIKVDETIAEVIEKIKDLEAKLLLKETEIEEISKSVYKKNIKDLQTSLDAGGGTVEQIVLTEKSPAVGQKLSKLEFPNDSLIGMIVRDDEVVIPHGDTVLQAGDKITVLGKKEDVDAAISFLTKK